MPAMSPSVVINNLIKQLYNNKIMNTFYKTHTDSELRIENRLLEIRSAFLFRLLHHLRGIKNNNRNNNKNIYNMFQLAK